MYAQGKHVNPTYPYWILFALYVLGTVFGLFTVETYNAKLPDSLEDARHFGEDQKFWSLPPAKKSTSTTTTADVVHTVFEAEELNQIKYAP